jgi:hypothetical protein
MLIHNAEVTGSLKINNVPFNSGSFSGSFQGDGSQLTGITGATTASYVEYSNVANKPALVSSSAQIVGYGIFATTGSNQFNGNQAITGSLTVTGQVVAQTLNVQQVTSSIVFSSGSNVFGNSQSNTQQFTGSVSVTGSLTVVTAGTELQVTSTGVNLGNIVTDNHNVTGSLRVSGSIALTGAGTFSSSVTANGLNALGSTLNNGNAIRFYRAGLVEMGYIGWSNENANNSTWFFKSSNGNPIGFSADGTNQQLFVNISGNIGIGTTDPGARLTVTTPTTGVEAENIRLEMNTSAVPSSAGLNFRFGSVNGATIYGVGENGGNGASSMRFYTHNGTSSAERMRIASNGIVTIYGNLLLGTIAGGISTSSPNSINLTSTFSNTGGSNLKLKLFEDTGGNIYGIGVSNARMDFNVPSGAAYSFYTGNVLIGTTSNPTGAKLRVNGNLLLEGFQRMYTYYIVVGPSSTGTITISSPTGTNMQGSMQVMAGGYGNGITGNITGLWMVGGLLFFNNASTSTITQIVNSVTSDGSMSFQRSGDQYTVSLTNTAPNPTGTKSFYVSVIINGE